VCGIQRPPRASHCRMTNRCIERWDHYCPWVGTAVGRRNYRWFLLFVASTAALALSVASSSFLHLRLIGEALRRPAAAGEPPPWRDGFETAPSAPRWLRAVAAAPLSCALAAYAAAVTLLLAALGAYHAYLVSINQTTYENMRGAYDLEPNPFDEGAARNWAQACCGVPPSLLPLVQEAASADLETGGRAGSLRGGGWEGSAPRDGCFGGTEMSVGGGSSAAACKALAALDLQEATRRQAFVESEGLELTSAMMEPHHDAPADPGGVPPRDEPPPSPGAAPWDGHDSESSASDSDRHSEGGEVLDEVLLMDKDEAGAQGDSEELMPVCENTAFV
jgi:hypothetical protein